MSYVTPAGPALSCALGVQATLRLGTSATQSVGIVPKETGAEKVRSTVASTGVAGPLLTILARKITVPPSWTLVRGGKLDHTYQITVPEDLDAVR